MVFLRQRLCYDLLIVNKQSRKSTLYDSPATYQIIVLGKIDPTWSDRLEGMALCLVTVEADSPLTTLVGELSDQAALAGVLNTLYELHLPVISVKRLNY